MKKGGTLARPASFQEENCPGRKNRRAWDKAARQEMLSSCKPLVVVGPLAVGGDVEALALMLG
jgi:hypothetical protein